jgi:hypothetical protein
MPATIENQITVDNQNPLAAFDALGIAPKARFRLGKWKGYNVEWVRKVESSYLEWLAGQTFFVEGHSRMVTFDKAKRRTVDQKKPSRRRLEPSVQLDDIQLGAEPDRNVQALDLAPTESLTPPRSPLAFTVAGNVISVAAWGR